MRKNKPTKKANDTSQEVASQYVINDFTLVSPDRGSKDIGYLKTGVLSAESVHFPNRVQLYDLYHDITTMDAHLRGIIQKRIDNVINKTLKFKNRKGEVDKDVTKLLKSEDGRQLITEIINSKFWGISGFEFVIGKNFAFKKIERKHIKPEKGLITKSQYAITEANGYNYREMPFIWVVGQDNDLGLLLACSMYAIYKRGTMGDWAQYVEIFGQPVRIIYYDAYDTKTKGELKQLLDSSGSSLAMMIPKQAKFEMMDGKTSNGDGKLQDTLRLACNSEMSIAILGNTETTTSSASSGYAQSATHQEQQDEITASDLIFVENMLNSDHFLNILKSYGYDVEGGQFEYDLELNLSKLKLRMEIDKFVSEKVVIDDDYWYNTYGVPKPINYEQLKAEKAEKEKAAVPQPPAEPETVKPGAPSKKPKAKTDLIDNEHSGYFDEFIKILSDFFAQALPK